MTTDPLAVELAKYELERAKAESEAAKHQRAILEMKQHDRSDRRAFIGYVLFGLAVLVGILSAIGAMWHSSTSGHDEKVRLASEETEQQRLCLGLEDPTERQLCFAINRTEESDDGN